jgi:amino acid adenylation domain-containing protein
MSAPAELSPLKQRLLEKLLKAEAQRQVTEAPIVPREPHERVPLAPCQQQIWLHAQLDPQTATYNEPMTVHFTGSLDRNALERVVAELIRRHEIWRTTFAYVDGEVLQAIHEDLPISIPFHDLSALPESERQAEAIRLATLDARRPFDLAVGPLMRARLVKMDDTQHQLCVVQHLLIHDGVTIYSIFMSELATIYNAFAKGLPSPLSPPRLQYADFALWQKRFLESATEPQVAYWRKQLAGELLPLDLPSDRPRPAVFTFRGAVSDFVMPEKLGASAREAAGAEGVTTYTFMLTAFKALLFRYTGREDILVGTPAGCRQRREFEQLAGFLMNTLVLRTKPSANRTFREYLHEVRDTVLDALANADVPLDRVARELQLPRDPSRHPAFDVSFTLEPSLAIHGTQWNISQSEVFSGSAKWDLDFQLDEQGSTYAARLTYNTDLFDATTIERFYAHWVVLLEGAVRNPNTRLAELPLLTREETEDIVVRRNSTHQDLARSTISELFERQSALTPNSVAVICGTASLTYAELNTAANRLAHRLRHAGAQPNAIVALCVERSCDMLVAILAVLKSGAAYLPLDSELPDERKQFILEDSRAALMLTEATLLTNVGKFAPAQMRIVHCGEGSGNGANLMPIASPEDIAHVLYTSGSTGKPKGVEVPHRAVVNFLQSMRRAPGFTAHDTLLAVTTISFDIAGLELYLPLISGGQVVVANRAEARDPRRLQELMREHAPTVMQATPATWRALIEDGWTGNGGMKVLCGGEAMNRDLAEQLLPRCQELWNMYGPTETTIWSTAERVTTGSGPVSIGRPIGNTQVFVLDPQQKLVPDGVTGELYIGGQGVTRGYLGQPELTAEKFVNVEVAGTARLYRTGDLARWTRDGKLECLGRGDNQVKIRGFRVEVEEIEALLAQHPDLRAAAVRAWPDASGHLALAAYIVAKGKPDLRAFLQGKLPYYMVPAAFLYMDELPLTPNLKVDRRKLPAPEVKPEIQEYVAAENDQERQLAGIWKGVLGVPNIGTQDDFFRSGGHSLLVPKLLSRVETSFGVRLPISSLFSAPTIREFALLLKDPANRRTSRTASIGKGTVGGPLLWLYPGSEMRGIIEHLKRPFIGVAMSPDEAALPQGFTFEEVAKRLVREIRSLQPDGPYTIGGWCSSGIVAYEVASQLQAEGCVVNHVVFLDTVNPTVYFNMPMRRRVSKAQYHLRRIAGLRPRQIGDYLHERAAWASERFRPKAPVSEASYEDRFFSAAQRYNTPTYAGRVLTIVPERMPSYREPLLNWGYCVTGGLKIIRVPGDHIGMFKVSAAMIAAAIDEAMTQAAVERENRDSLSWTSARRRAAS